MLDNTNYTGIFIFLLQARRSEKDFIMRGRNEYVEKVKKRITQLIERTNQSTLGMLEKTKIIDLANEYLTTFMKLVDISKSMSYLDKNLTKLDKESFSYS